MWFARQLVCNVEPMNVKRVSAQATAFELELADGERFLARGVVVAAGHLHFSHLPPELRTLPPEFLSHSCRYGDLAAHAGKRVAVVGAGQSALETAVLLARNGAVPTLVARTPELLWNPVPLNGTRPLRTRIRAPISGLGPGWRMRLYSDAPQAFLRLPEATRLRLVRTVLGPAGAWWLRDEFEREVAVRLNRHIAGARTDGDAVRLQLVSGAGSEELEVDHVVAATGYRVDVGRLTFLSPSLKASVQRVEGAPVLNRRMESTVPGLFFIGLAAAPSFGPVMRFVYGTGFASRTVTRAIYSSG
jgi:cation diffusion facilitator CzcD-associated flavoprotein CzcO